MTSLDSKENFIISVSEWGVPHGLSITPLEPLDNVHEFSPEEYCHFYWNTQKLKISYQFRIGLIDIKRIFEINVPLSREKRCCEPPIIRYQAASKDGDFYSTIRVGLNLSKIKVLNFEKKLLSMRFNLEEEDGTQLFRLSTLPFSNGLAHEGWHQQTTGVLDCIGKSCNIYVYAKDPSRESFINYAKVEAIGI